MKNKILLSAWMLFIFAFFSCEEEGEKAVVKSNVTPNAIQNLSSASFVLLYDDSEENFEAISWTELDYGFPAAVSSTLELAKTGENFANPVALATTPGNSVTVTVGELNEALLSMGLMPEEASDVQLRVRSDVNNNISPVFSSPLALTMTPYATTFPPIYIIGDAQGWNLANALEMQSTGPGTYETIGTFQENGKFRFFATPSWDAQQWGWSFFNGGTVATGLSDGADGDSNFLFDLPTGYYKISVSLKDKTIGLEASSAPTLFIIGDAQGWNLGNALEMHSLGSGQFEVIGQFQQNGKFRFFSSPDWAADQFRWSSFAGGTVDSELADGADGDSNFLFTAASGIYKMIVSINDKTISVESSAEPTLYIIGQDQGWSLANAFKLTWLGGGKYEGATTFSTNATFRLFDKPDWPNGFGNYPYFGDEGEVSPLLENANDGDLNFRFVGTSGNFTMSVDLYNLKVEMNP
jgi:hypothetical protein